MDLKKEKKSFVANVLLTRHGGNLGKRQFEKYLLLIVYDVYSGPIDSYDNVIFRQIRARISICLVKARKQQWPLKFGITNDIFFNA